MAERAEWHDTIQAQNGLTHLILNRHHTICFRSCRPDHVHGQQPTTRHEIAEVSGYPVRPMTIATRQRLYGPLLIKWMTNGEKIVWNRRFKWSFYTTEPWRYFFIHIKCFFLFTIYLPDRSHLWPKQSTPLRAMPALYEIYRTMSRLGQTKRFRLARPVWPGNTIYSVLPAWE